MDRRRGLGLAAAGVAALTVGVLIGSSLADDGAPDPAPSPTVVPTPTPTVTPTPAPSPTPTGSPTQTPSPTGPDVEAPEVTTATIASESPAEGDRPAIEVDVAYPQLTGLADVDVQDRVNTAITAAMEAEVAAFLEAAGEPVGGPAPGNSITSRFTVGAVDPHVLSVVVPIQTYTGGAHPYTVVRTFTFDLADGEPLGLRDLFEPGILERVSGIAVERIDDEFGTGDWAVEGAAPTEDALGRFVLTAAHLQVWFDNYQVGPYAIGTPSVDIAYEDLADLVPPDGIVAAIADPAEG